MITRVTLRRRASRWATVGGQYVIEKAWKVEVDGAGDGSTVYLETRKAAEAVEAWMIGLAAWKRTPEYERVKGFSGSLSFMEHAWLGEHYPGVEEAGETAWMEREAHGLEVELVLGRWMTAEERDR